MKSLFAPITTRDISRHRGVLYGFAALWILFYHMGSRPEGTLLLPLRVFQILGACGVEFFVMLTGFGLYQSMNRDPRPSAFLIKRFQRVFLPAFIVSAVYYGAKEGGLAHYLSKITYFSYWLGKNCFWYVSFILTMYLIYPAVYSLQKRRPKALWLLLAASILGTVIVSCMDNAWADNCSRAVFRIPVFFLSCIIAPWMAGDKELPRWALPASLAGSVILLLSATLVPASLFHFVRTAGYVCLSSFLIILITAIAPFFTRGILRRFIYRFFALCGEVSLEIYLLYSRITNTLKELPAYVAGETTLLKIEFAGIILTLVSALLLSRLCRFLISAFQSVSIPEYPRNEVQS